MATTNIQDMAATNIQDTIGQYIYQYIPTYPYPTTYPTFIPQQTFIPTVHQPTPCPNCGYCSCCGQTLEKEEEEFDAKKYIDEISRKQRKRGTTEGPLSFAQSSEEAA